VVYLRRAALFDHADSLAKRRDLRQHFNLIARAECCEQSAYFQETIPPGLNRLLKKPALKAREKKTVPQGLKLPLTSLSLLARFGPAKAGHYQSCPFKTVRW
jgi:hypothetical protein